VSQFVVPPPISWFSCDSVITRVVLLVGKIRFRGGAPCSNPPRKLNGVYVGICRIVYRFVLILVSCNCNPNACAFFLYDAHVERYENSSDLFHMRRGLRRGTRRVTRIEDEGCDHYFLTSPPPPPPPPLWFGGTLPPNLIRVPHWVTIKPQILNLMGSPTPQLKAPP